MAIGAVVFVLLSAIAAAALGGKGSSPAVPGAKLTIGKVKSSSSEVEQGAKFTVVLQLRNGSARVLSKAGVRGLLSLDRRADRGDAVVGRSSVNNLHGKGARRLGISAAVPAGMKPGAYWLIVCASARSAASSRVSVCTRAATRLEVKAAAPSSQLSPPPPLGSGAPPGKGGEEPKAPINASVGACRPGVIVSALANQPSVIEGGQIEYSASVRNEPMGACLDVAGAPTVAGEIEVTTSAAVLGMWIEVDDGAQRDVLPLSSGLTASGAAVPAACPGGELAGCEATVQEIVGNVFFPEGRARSVEPGAKAVIPFHFFPTFAEEDLEQIATAPVGAVHFVTAAETDGGEILLASHPLDFSSAPSLNDVKLEVELPDGEDQVSELGAVAAGDQLDAEPAALYTTSEEDPDTVTASFRARAESPQAVSSEPVVVSTVVTNDPNSRPDVFPTAFPSAATIGTEPTVLVGVSLVGNVESEPTVVLVGPETELGTLNDEGGEGDAIAGDGIWSGEVQVPMTETRALRVDALLGGIERSGQVEVEALPDGAPTEPAASNGGEATIETAGGGSVLANRIVIQMAEASAYSEVVTAAETVGGTVAGRISADTWQIAIPAVADEEELNEVLAEISTAAGVIGAEGEPVYESSDVVPNDPLYGQQSHLTQIEANKAWIVARGGSSRIVTAIIDSGVDRDHPDLASRLLPGTDFAEDDNNPEDTCGHGTHVAGLVGAATNNGKQVAGVNWNAALLPVKVFPDVAGPSHCHDVGAVDVAAAIRWAVDHGARVINLSLGGRLRDEADVKALQYAWEAGRVVVAAAGNLGSSIKEYPAGYERTEQFSSWFGFVKRTYRTDVIAVGNVTGNDVREFDSNFGSWVDISAPGNLLSTFLNGGTEIKRGTSMSSPVVAGVASLMIGNGVFGPERIRSLLVSTGKPLNQGVGPRVNAFEAVFNGSFEGGLETWHPSGTVGTISRLGPIVPPKGSRMLELSTGPAGAEVRASVSKVMQLRNDALRNGAVNLSLSYDYVTEEYPEYVGSQYNDSLIIVAHLPNGETRVLANESVNATNWTPVSGIDFPGGDTTVGQSGWKTASTTIPASALGGSGDLTIEVFDVGDEIFDSVALVDAVQLQ